MDAYLNRSVFLSPAMAWSGWGNMGTQEVVNVWGYYTSDPMIHVMLMPNGLAQLIVVMNPLVATEVPELTKMMFG